jgi:hypothetical protein
MSANTGPGNGIVTLKLKLAEIFFRPSLGSWSKKWEILGGGNKTAKIRR